LPFFFAEREGDRAFVRGADAEHLARSLRVRVGEEIQVVDPAGFLLTVRVETLGRGVVAGRVLVAVEHRSEPARSVVVAIAQLPAAALDLVLSRCTEVGAAGFHVVQAERSVARGARLERWQTIVREAAMLAGRLKVPPVEGPSSLEDVLGKGRGTVMLVRDAERTLGDMPHHGDITLLIGPEGGWTERELAMSPVHASLGPRNLRADTAAIVATAIAIGI
jgi:16S rRNA (uracil1498-N3)-methyltransferase